MRKIKLIIPVFIVMLDQIVKYYVRKMPSGHVWGCIDGIVRMVHSSNTGAAFSILSGNTLFLVLLSILLIIIVLYFVFFRLNLTNQANTAFLFLLGGGIGNLIDRIVFSGVTDYIQLLFIDFPIFNLADISITLSVLYLVYLILLGKLEKDN